MAVKTLDQMTRDELHAEQDRVLEALQALDPNRTTESGEEADLWRQQGEIEYLLKTICNNCGKAGADDHHDGEGIYAGRWHDRCETPADRHRKNYRWQPGDEPLDED